MALGELPAVVETNEKGKIILAPERFKNASEMREVCQAIIAADRPRSLERSSVDKVANGNPVYRLEDLRAKKQGWRARTNYRGLEGKLDGLENIFYDLNSEVDPAVRVFLDYGKDPDREDWEEIIAREYTRMLLQQWLPFDYHIPLRNKTMLRHGLGTHVWPIKNKWEPRTPTAGQVLFPEDASIDFHTAGESFLLREFCPAHILYGYIRNEKAADRMGWNVDAVWKTLAEASKSWRGGTGNNITPEELQKSMQAGDYGTSMSRQAGAWLNYFFNIEVDTRKISKYIISETLPSGEYLFKKRNRFDSFADVLCIFPYDIPASGLLNGIRGFGARTREHYELMNRVYNAMADNVLLSMYPQFQQNGTVDPDKMRLMRIGAMTIYPQNITPTMLNLPNLAQGGIPLSQMLAASVNENNQTYLSGTPEPKDRETAVSFQMRAQDSGQVSKATHSLYFRNQTRFHDKVLRTALKAPVNNEPWSQLAREMKRRILSQGVPEAALSNIADIEAMRSVGAGSPSNKIQALSALWTTIYPTTTEPKKIAMERDLTAAFAGYSMVNRYARSLTDQDIPNQDDSLIALENDALGKGGVAVANTFQDQVKHATGHFQSAGQILQAVQQGQMDPEEGLHALQSFGQHLADHLKLLQGNPQRKQEFDQLQKQLEMLGKMTDQLAQHIQQQQDNPPPDPQQVGSDTLQIGLAKVNADSQVKQAKFQSDSALKAQKLAVDTRLKYGQAAANTRIAAVKTAANARISAGKAVADVRTKRLALTNGSKA